MTVIAIGADHAGYSLKEDLKAWLVGGGHQVLDFGTHSLESVDYPDFAGPVADAVTSGAAAGGVLVCGTGMGMAMAANKLDGVRAAVCLDPLMARMSREHNDANVLALGARLTEGRSAVEILQACSRHRSPVAVTSAASRSSWLWSTVMPRLAEIDPDVAKALREEAQRQHRNLELIASENFVSEPVLEALGSVLTNKYAEGYPGRRYYGGCEVVDIVEDIAIARAKELFGAQHANVQPHSGAQANMAVYFTALKPGDTVLGPNLSHGGHLTAGSPVNYSGKFYTVVPYGVRRDTERIDLDQVRDLAKQHRPKMIIAGGSAFPRAIDFQPFADVAREVGAVLMADIAHPAGLVAAGLHPSPVGLADFVTTTTHKTLRGPRGGMVMCGTAHAQALDKTVMPGVQGGPLMHVIAAKAVAFKEALTPEWRRYQGQVIENARALADALMARGYRLVSGGTDTHLMLIDLSGRNITGKDAQEALDRAWITVNKNTVPFETKSPMVTSGVRIGTPAVTTRGMREPEMAQIAALIDQVLANLGSTAIEARVRGEVQELTNRFPLYPERRS